MDPAAAKLWTLSASDMNDEEMVYGFVCEALVFFLLSPFLLSLSVVPLGKLPQDKISHLLCEVLRA